MNYCPSSWDSNRNRKYSEIWCCGRNDHGQLGTGCMNDKERILPNLNGIEQNPISNPEERKVIEWCEYSELLSPIQGGSSGSMHTIYLSQDTLPSHAIENTSSRKKIPKIGSLYSTGSNNTGQLGLNNKYDQTTPVRVDALFHFDREVLDIKSGAKHNIAIVRPYNTNITELWTWGQGWFGRLGHGSERFQLKPKLILSMRQLQISQVSCGGNSTACITKDGKLYTWGYNKHGQCGLGDTSHLDSNNSCTNGITRPSPAKVPTRNILISVSLGHEHSLVLDSIGNIYAAGSNNFGQLGIGGKMGSEKYKENSFKLVEVKDIIQISCGGEHCLAINSKGEIYSWGRIEKGRCGMGKIKDNINIPRLIPTLSGVFISKIFAMDAHNFAITKDKRAYSWGLNKYGQCGFLSHVIDYESEAFQTTPRLLEHIRGIDMVIGGGNCAAGFSSIMITELKYILWQHIRDLNLTNVQRIISLPTANNILCEYDESGYTALHWACELGAKSIITCLLKHSQASKFINLQTSNINKYSALHICASLGYYDCTTCLLQNDISTQLLDNNGRTAVHLATISSHFQLAALIIEHADHLGIQSPLLLQDNNKKNPMQYCNFEDAYLLKKNTNQYYDIILVFSADQTILGEKLASFLESKKIKCWYNKSAQYAKDDILLMVEKSRGIIFIVGNTSVQDGSEERDILMAAKEYNLNIFPLWHEKIDLEADMEAIIFRFQLVDFSDDSQFTLSGNILAIAIKTSLMKEPKQDDNQKLDNNNNNNEDILDTNIAIQDALNAPFYEQTIFLSYDKSDSEKAKILLDYFEIQREIQVFDSAVCNDSQMKSNAAKHCFAVLLILSEKAVNSIDVRDEISVAENNRKPIYAIKLEECTIPIDFQYALAITPYFIYHKEIPQETVNQITRALRLKYNIDRKTIQYNNLLKEVKRAENLLDFAKAHHLDTISYKIN